MIQEHHIEIRVRYQETDGQGHVHHANYFSYFELGRTEMLRAAGIGYERIEQLGIKLVVAEISCRYHRPAQFGEVLVLHTHTVSAKGARIRHRYELFRGDLLLAEGESTVACVDNRGRVQRLPQVLLGTDESMD